MARMQAHDGGTAAVLDRALLDPDTTVDLVDLLAEVESSWLAASLHRPRREGGGNAWGDRDPDRRGEPTGDVVRAQADILVVDDDEDVRSSMAAVLRSVGYTVFEAVDGQSALDVLVGCEVEMILLDLHMAPRDGVWFLEQAADTPAVVVVSAFALYDEKAVRARFSDRVSLFLRKPVAPPMLLAAVRDALGPQPGP
jgi:CheY-like chemotaxis protein